MSANGPEDDEIQKLREKRMNEMMDEINRSQNPGVLTVDELNFQSFLSENRFAVLDMWAEWCGPCRRIAPAIEELAVEFSGTVAFGKCNTDENPNIAGSFAISAIPTILFFSEGRMVNRITGAYPKEAIERQIRSSFPSI